MERVLSMVDGVVLVVDANEGRTQVLLCTTLCWPSFCNLPISFFVSFQHLYIYKQVLILLSSNSSKQLVYLVFSRYTL